MNDIKIPVHLGIIMDGNGRWAKMRNQKRTFGHERGAEVAEDVIQWCSDLGVRYLTLYSFSTENWKRPEEEVNFLFKLFVKYLESRMMKIINKGVRMRFTGRINELPEDVKKSIEKISQKSKNNTKLDLVMALNYGGRQEITDAVNKIIQSGNNQKITEKMISENTYLPDVPEPDLIIRTSGEIRMSNFLLWESAYSELYFTEKLWPDFNYEDLTEAFREFSLRERRFGDIKEIGSDKGGC